VNADDLADAHHVRSLTGVAGLARALAGTAACGLGCHGEVPGLSAH
jgi:hypothetical protein